MELEVTTQPTMRAQSPCLLELRDVGKAYGQAAKRFMAVEGVNLVLRAGEFLCLLGPSGCGKSTLLRMIAGLQAPSAGTVLYRGDPLVGVNPHATIVFQSFALFPWLTVQENVEVALKAGGMPASHRGPRARALLDTVGLDGFESAYPRELSGGMRQKVGFARAMAVEPELLCLDEPFSALDVLSAEALRGELLELWLSHVIPTRAILMVTHNIEEAVLMADRIVVMAKDPGRVVTEVPILLRHPRRHKDAAFQGLVDKVYAAVAGRTAGVEAPGAGPGQGGRMQRLPAARLNALAGLLEKLAAEGGRNDLYRLSGELVMELDDMLPIVDAGRILGLLAVAEGDLFLTPLGQAYADASILARKELLAGRILRLPVIAWIYETLQQDEDHRVAEEFFVDKLRLELDNFAESELDRAISWGRFAELFAFDDDRDELYLETDS